MRGMQAAPSALDGVDATISRTVRAIMAYDGLGVAVLPHLDSNQKPAGSLVGLAA